MSEVEAMNRMRNLEKLPCPEDCPEAIYNVMLECWRLDVARRTVSADIVQDILLYINNTDNDIVAYANLQWPEFVPSADRSNESNLMPVNTYIDLESEEVSLRFAALEVPHADIHMGTELGRGQFGTVSLATLVRAGQSQSVAVKTLSGVGVPDAEQQQFEYEAKLLSALEHSSIVRVVAVSFREAPHQLVLELMSGGDLKSYLKAHRNELMGGGSSGAGELMHACSHIADAMAYLERRRSVHRDLAARFVSVENKIPVHFLPGTCWLAAAGLPQ
jgi:hypothetical protein